MFHEDLQAHIVGEDRLSSARARSRAVHARRHVRRRRVQLRQQEPRLTAALVAYDVPWDREPVDEQVLRIRDRSLQQLLEVLVALLVLISGLAPLRDRLAVEDEDVEERVEQQDDVRLDRHAVEQHRLRRRLVDGIGHERGLDHDQRIVDVFFVQDVSWVARQRPQNERWQDTHL